MTSDIRPGEPAEARVKLDGVLAQILALIKENPGIRPSEINRRLNRIETDALRAKLIRLGLVRKVQEGRETRLYAVE